MTGIPFVETHDELSSDEEIPTHDFDIDKDVNSINYNHLTRKKNIE